MYVCLNAFNIEILFSPGIIRRRACFPLKSERPPFVYLRNSNTTGQPTDSIILARCKRRGSQQESLTRASSRLAFHASTHQPDASATRSFLNCCRDYPHRFVTTARHRLMYFSFLRQRMSDTRELPPPMYIYTYVRTHARDPRVRDVIRSANIFQRRRREKCFHPGWINCQTRNNLNAARTNFAQTSDERCNTIIASSLERVLAVRRSCPCTIDRTIKLSIVANDPFRSLPNGASFANIRLKLRAKERALLVYYEALDARAKKNR